jgi:ABC-type bacteriocin/lantibiotic exporter with double-glycine peptidase domain
MSIGALVAFNALVALANAPIVTLMTLWDNLQHATVYLNRPGRHLPDRAGAGQ